MVILGRYHIISEGLPMTISPQIIQYLHWMYLINMLYQISCRETASVLAITCPIGRWGWNEKSQLEYVCESLGVEALITTKYHAEYAGEGIEYSWGASKAVYRRYPLASKKGKENFDKLVSKCISRELLTNDRIRKFSRRARSYMLTYKSLDYIHEDGGEESKMTSNTITHTKIESMKKILKSHRAALDFDRAFVVTSIKTLDVAFDWQKELGDCETMTNKKRKRIK